MSYKRKKIVTIESVTYDDGQVMYSLVWDGEGGKNSAQSGLHNETELIIEVLKHIGKLEMKAKVFVSNDYPNPNATPITTDKK